ncbi:deoxyguanosinetriphosphate triphosphohydrolase [Canibacter sp. lx-45]|uniref:deoxyguanosinetriphosphate triphosphohydrolase n=1 Tax=Canibacter zhuwentaonis TaxID=2837491 RepID=UPI001BDBC317|nr:deoxyguanosinetriphosphate triphosphohydrolase [Canibacter zhuwentaonis]MBT1035689.1 deoxyguanosinetriphosphate triphosphohydrolase [Canibacter zhuwentaonis]
MTAVVETQELLSAQGYAEADFERYTPESHGTQRGDFARDRARIIHSYSWRRLAAKTQVLSPIAGLDFARNRLTHSLEVAQIGRELAASFGVSCDLVDSACLAHDLGHPPFGHNGEVALNAWADDVGGFEGNAQTLRILSRLEAKKYSPAGDSVGLNLTRATLDASCKYPWSRSGGVDEAPRAKFGYYLDDKPVFDWLREGAVTGKKCFEAQLMDLADDIAYSVHDFEDAVFGEYIDPLLLNSRAGHEQLLQSIVAWNGADAASCDEVAVAFERLAALPGWLHSWSGSRQDAAQLKNLTSDLIGRFVKGAVAQTCEGFARHDFARYGADVLVPVGVRAEVAVFKGLVAAFVMNAGRSKPAYQQQRDVLTELLQKLWREPAHLEPVFAADFATAKSEQDAKRAVVDQVASLTDAGAVALHSKLCALGS